jgi:hypothetical protein
MGQGVQMWGKPHLPLPSVGLGCIVVSYTSIFLCVRYVYELMNILVLGTADSGRPFNANSCRVSFNSCTMTFLGRFLTFLRRGFNVYF